jgi:hypothetical protein
MNRDQKYHIQEHPAPHSGLLLTTYFKEKRIRKSALAREMNRRPDTIYGFEKNSSIQTAILWEICHALKHNFFADIALLLPTTYSQTISAETLAKDQRIAQLEQENLLITNERDLLLKVLRER